MKKQGIKIIAISLIVVILGIIAAFCIPQVKVALFGMQLSYKYIPGAKAEYTSDIDITTKMELKDAPELLKNNFKDNNSKITAKQKITRQIESVDGNIATVKITNVVESMEVEALGRKNTLPKEALASQKGEMVIRVNPTGEVLSSDKQKNSNGLGSNSDSVDMMYQQIVFPIKAMRPGFTWTKEFDDLVAAGMSVKMDGKTDYTFTGIEKYKGTDCAVINYKGEFKSDTGNDENKDKAKNSNHAGTMQGKMEGRIYFDYKNGEIAAVTNNIDADGQTTLKNVNFGNNENKGFTLMTKASLKNQIERLGK